MARGHLRKRSEGSWSIVIELERDPATGQRRQKWLTVRGTKRDAERELARLLVEAERGRLGVSPNVTLAEYMERWLKDHAEPNLTPKTYLRYCGLVRNNITPYLGRVPLDKLKPSQVASWHTQLRTAPRGDGKDGVLSPTTRKQAHAVLHSALEHAVKWGLIPTNPASNVDAPRAAHHEMATFTAEQAMTFLEAVEPEGSSWHAFFYILMSTGLRLAEITGLRWQDIDLDDGTLAVRQTIYAVPKIGLVVRGTKSTAGRRPIVLDTDAIVLLRRHRVSQNETRLMAGSAWDDRDLVFPNEVGAPLSEKTIRRVFKQTCKRVGLPIIRLHDLRYTSATLLLKAGVHPKIVSERLGHTNVNITLNIYSHVTQTLQREAAEKLGMLLRRPTKTDSGIAETNSHKAPRSRR